MGKRNGEEKRGRANEESINAVAFKKLITIMAEKKCEIYSAKTHQFFPGNFCLIFGQSNSGYSFLVTKKN